jgi:hypothetical protein
VVKRATLLVPLQGKRLQSTGDTLVRAEVVLLLVSADGQWHLTTFRADSGTEVTTVPASLARRLNLPMPAQPTAGLNVTGFTGTQAVPVRAGVLKARFFGLEEHEFRFPCYFVGDPDAPAEEGGPSRQLLGLTGVVDKVEWSFDGVPRIDAPHGLLILSKK